jgi:hypothetical protein
VLSALRKVERRTGKSEPSGWREGGTAGSGETGEGVITAGDTPPDEESEGDMDTGEAMGGEVTMSVLVCGTETREGLWGSSIFAWPDMRELRKHSKDDKARTEDNSKRRRGYVVN